MQDIDKEMEDAHEDYQVDNGIEQIESLLGIGLVVAQTYIAGTVADANRIIKPPKRLSKETLLKLYSDNVPNTNVTQLELCDAMANYFKHHDEWSDWSAAGRHQKTIAVLRAVGIEQFGGIPFDTAMAVLWPGYKGLSLDPLVELLVNWRAKVIEACLQEMA